MTKPTPAQLRAKAAAYLRDQGHSLSQVSAALGVSKTQVSRMCEQQSGQAALIAEMDVWVTRQIAIEEARHGS